MGLLLSIHYAFVFELEFLWVAKCVVLLFFTGSHIPLDLLGCKY